MGIECYATTVTFLMDFMGTVLMEGPDERSVE
jgi:hypothetical protein